MGRTTATVGEVFSGQDRAIAHKTPQLCCHYMYKTCTGEASQNQAEQGASHNISHTAKVSLVFEGCWARVSQFFRDVATDIFFMHQWIALQPGILAVIGQLTEIKRVIK